MHFEMCNYRMIDPMEKGNDLRTVREITQWYTTRLEELIRTVPGQYWWLHRRWKDTREKKPAKQAA
jgi:lauroyl/myristoyl acyltransferase